MLVASPITVVPHERSRFPEGEWSGKECCFRGEEQPPRPFAKTEPGRRDSRLLLFHTASTCRSADPDVDRFCVRDKRERSSCQ